MANFIQNLQKIRGEAIYGQDMRTAIADAIQQAAHFDYRDVDVPYPDTDQVYVRLIPVSSGSSDYILTLSKDSEE